MTLSHAIMASPPVLSKALFLDSISQTKWQSTHISSWYSKNILSWKGGKGIIKNNGTCCWGQWWWPRGEHFHWEELLKLRCKNSLLGVIFRWFFLWFAPHFPYTHDKISLSALETALNAAISMVVPCLQLSQGISCRDTSSKDWAAVYKH